MCPVATRDELAGDAGIQWSEDYLDAEWAGSMFVYWDVQNPERGEHGGVLLVCECGHVYEEGELLLKRLDRGQVLDLPPMHGHVGRGLAIDEAAILDAVLRLHPQARIEQLSFTYRSPTPPHYVATNKIDADVLVHWSYPHEDVNVNGGIPVGSWHRVTRAVICRTGASYLDGSPVKLYEAEDLPLNARDARYLYERTVHLRAELG